MRVTRKVNVQSRTRQVRARPIRIIHIHMGEG